MFMRDLKKFPINNNKFIVTIQLFYEKKLDTLLNSICKKQVVATKSIIHIV